MLSQILYMRKVDPQRRLGMGKHGAQDGVWGRITLPRLREARPRDSELEPALCLELQQFLSWRPVA